MTIDPIGELDDRSIVLAVQYLAEDLSPGDAAQVRTEAEARLVISALLAEARVADADPGELLPGEPAAIAAARRALEAAAGDEDTREPTLAILTDPPRDEQMSVEAALASTAVLALLISWLQTKVEFRVHRKGGKTEVEFAIGKQAADTQVLRAIAATFSSILGIPVGKTPEDVDS